VGGVGGNVNNLHHLGNLIGQSRPVIGFQTRGILGHRPHDSIEATATENLRYMRRHQPNGPYLIAGYSGGALTAFEMVRQLVAAGEEVQHLFVLDTYAPGFASDFKPKRKGGIKERIAHEIEIMRTQPTSEVVDRFSLIARRRLVRGPVLAFMKRFDPLYYRMQGTRTSWLAAAARYRGGPTTCPLTLFLAEPSTERSRAVLRDTPLLGWDKVLPPEMVEVVNVPGNHNSMVLGKGAETIAASIEERLA
jgi:thioesterase domain-containing protein